MPAPHLAGTDDGDALDFPSCRFSAHTTRRLAPSGNMSAACSRGYCCYSAAAGALPAPVLLLLPHRARDHAHDEGARRRGEQPAACLPEGAPERRRRAAPADPCRGLSRSARFWQKAEGARPLPAVWGVASPIPWVELGPRRSKSRIGMMRPWPLTIALRKVAPREALGPLTGGMRAARWG